MQAVQQEQAAFHEAAKELLRSRVFMDRSAAYPLDLIAHPRSTPLMVRMLTPALGVSAWLMVVLTILLLSFL